MRKAFYQSSAETAKKSPVKAYIFGDANDETRTKAFVDLLLTHHIDVYGVENTAMYNGQRFEAAKTYIVPTDQPNYIMIRSVFEKGITYTDSLFYDASTWSLIHAYDLPYAELKTAVPRGKKISSVSQAASTVERSNYVYAFDLRDYNAHKAIYHLQSKGVIVQSAFRPFSTPIAGTAKTFGYGSIIISVQLQKISADSIFKVVSETGKTSNIKIYSVGSGFNTSGIDLGSGYVRTLRMPEAMMLTGQGVAATEAGEIWHLLDQRLGMPITKMDITNFVRADINRYNTIVMVSGSYTALDKTATDKLKLWLQNGGILIALKTAGEWAIKQGFTKEKLVAPDTTKPKTMPRFNYDDAVNIEGAKALGGSIFAVDLDTTHPIGFGTTNRKISIYKNGQTIFSPSANTYSTIAQYTNNPLIGGYLHASTLKKIKGNAAIVVGAEGNGKVIFFADNPNFRGTWYGTNKLFLNALFFGSHINVPVVAE
jgi:hypothetical protein